MDATRRLLFWFLLLFAAPLLFGEDSPILSTAISADDSPAAVAAARDRGAASAGEDIKRGTLRILYFGLPWSSGKRLIDESTGYRVQVVEGCVVTGQFAAEVEAYNHTMREWHAKKASTATHK
jgi:hypothetical protein